MGSTPLLLPLGSPQATIDAAAAADVPGAGGAKKRPPARTSCVALSPTGRSVPLWVCDAAGELLVPELHPSAAYLSLLHSVGAYLS